MCHVLDVNPSSYYDWTKRDISNQKIHRNQSAIAMSDCTLTLQSKIIILFNTCSDESKKNTVFNVIVTNVLKSPSTQITINLIYPNLLNQKLDINRPNEAWISDITYTWTNEGWLYLVGVKDIYTKELVGYAINKRMTADLVYRALNMAIKNKRLSQGLIVHSDRGSQYCSNEYHTIIKQCKLKGSMSRRGNCFDNANIESF